jgi:hypothetical protein
VVYLFYIYGLNGAKTLNKMTHSQRALNLKTFSIKGLFATLSIKGLFATLSIKGLLATLSGKTLCTECHWCKYRVSFNIMLNVFVFSVIIYIMPSVEVPFKSTVFNQFSLNIL